MVRFPFGAIWYPWVILDARDGSLVLLPQMGPDIIPPASRLWVRIKRPDDLYQIKTSRRGLT